MLRSLASGCDRAAAAVASGAVLALTAARRLRPSTTARHADTVYPSVGRPRGRRAATTAWTCAGSPTRTLAGVARVRLVPARDGRFRLDLSAGSTSSRLAVTDRRDRRRVLDVPHRSAPRRLRRPVVAGTPYDVVRRATAAGPAPAQAPSSRRRHGRARLADHAGRPGVDDAGAVRRVHVVPRQRPPVRQGDLRVRLDVPRRWVGVSNGRLDSRMLSHGRTVTQFTSRDPMASYLVTVAIGPYERYTQTGPHGLPLTYWVPARQAGGTSPR